MGTSQPKQFNPIPAIEGMLNYFGRTDNKSVRNRTILISLLFTAIAVFNGIGRSFGTGNFETSAAVMGYPLLSIGNSPQGIIAIGDRAIGIFAVGGLAVGVIAFGGAALGLISFGGLSIGLILAIGGLAIGYYSCGGLSIGVFKKQ